MNFANSQQNSFNVCFACLFFSTASFKFIVKLKMQNADQVLKKKIIIKKDKINKRWNQTAKTMLDEFVFQWRTGWCCSFLMVCNCITA